MTGNNNLEVFGTLTLCYIGVKNIFMSFCFICSSCSVQVL